MADSANLRAIFLSFPQKKEPIQASYFMFLLLLFCVTYLLDALLVVALKNCTQGQVSTQWQEQNQIYNWMIFSQTPFILPNLLMIIFCYNTSSNHSPIYNNHSFKHPSPCNCANRVSIYTFSILCQFNKKIKKKKKKKTLGLQPLQGFFGGNFWKKNSKKARFLNQILV